MKANLIRLILLVGLILAASGCSQAPREAAAGELPAVPPDQVVQSFYDWFLDPTYEGIKDYHESEFVSSEYDKEMQKAGNDRPGNAFLCGAQDFPESVSVEPAAISAREARVPFLTSWGFGGEAGLRLEDGAWKIILITCNR